MPQTKADPDEGELLEGFTKYMPTRRPKYAPAFQSVFILRKGGLVLSSDLGQMLAPKAEVLYNPRTFTIALRKAREDDREGISVEESKDRGRYTVRGSPAILANYGYTQDEPRIQLKAEVKQGIIFVTLPH